MFYVDMKCGVFCAVVSVLLRLVSSIDIDELLTDPKSWGALSVSCRNDDNDPVDWWYIYKPPVDTKMVVDDGRHFVYVASHAPGKWTLSLKYINGNSMLQNTVGPMFKKTYREHLAVIQYEPRNSTPGSTLRGLLMADQLGGVWLGHTVPGFPTPRMYRVGFPESELEKGHLFVCLSLNLKTINELADVFLKLYPTVTYVQEPDYLEPLLESWTQYFNVSTEDVVPKFDLPYDAMTIKTKRGAEFLLFMRSPIERSSIYREFAKRNQIVLDVYSPSSFFPPYCGENYGIRTIANISVYSANGKAIYITKKSDAANFAVGAAYDNQTRESPWVCVSTVRRGESKMFGGVLICRHNRDVWGSFKSLKGKEPSCDDFDLTLR